MRNDILAPQNADKHTIEPWTMPPLADLLATLQSRGIELPPGNKRVGAFGDSAALSAELLALIRAGRKRGGACLLWTYEALREPMPEVGDIEIVVDHRNEPAIVTRTVQVDVVPFCDVSAAFAAIEGEGDGSLEYWRREHWRYFSRECERLGRIPDESMQVVCDSFELLLDLA